MPTVNLGPCDCCGGCGTWTDELIANVGFNFSFTQSSSAYDDTSRGLARFADDCSPTPLVQYTGPGPAVISTDFSVAVEGFASDRTAFYLAQNAVPADALWLSAAIQIDYEMPAGGLLESELGSYTPGGVTWDSQQVTYRNFLSVYVVCPRDPVIAAIVFDARISPSVPTTMSPPLDPATNLGGVHCNTFFQLPLGEVGSGLFQLLNKVYPNSAGTSTYTVITRSRIFVGQGFVYGEAKNTWATAFSVGNNPLP